MSNIKDKWYKIPLHNLRKEKYLDENHWPEFQCTLGSITC